MWLVGKITLFKDFSYLFLKRDTTKNKIKKGYANCIFEHFYLEVVD